MKVFRGQKRTCRGRRTTLGKGYMDIGQVITTSGQENFSEVNYCNFSREDKWQFWRKITAKNVLRSQFVAILFRQAI